MKLNSKILLLLALSIFWLTPFAVSQTPEQYGTPFTGVPDPRDATIYQVNMRCFSASGDFQGVMDRLDNIRELGANVLYLMPVQPVGVLKSSNSPYCLKDLKSVNSEFGTLTDLRNLIDSAHSKGMAVLLDWVANQTSWDHPWITAHPDWYVRVGGVIQTLDGYPDVAALDLENYSARAAMIDAMKYWVYAVNCDGFRCDYANKASVSFWTDAIDTLRSITTHNLLLFAEGDRSGNYTAGFDYNFSWNFYDKVKKIKNGSAATIISESNTFDYTGATGNQQVIRWLSNHDIYNSEGSPYLIFGGRNGTLANFVVAAYMKSVPFIYNGMEVGNTGDLPFPFTGATINWNEDLSVTPEMINILTFRNLSDAIRRGTMTDFSNTDICAFKKVSATDSAYVFINLRNSAKSFTLPAAIANKTIYDAYTGEAENLSSTLPLAAYQYRVFTNDGLINLTTKITIDTHDITIDGTDTYQLSAVVEPTDATYKSVYWESSNTNLVTVNAAGLVAGVSPGNTYIVAHTLNNNITDTCYVTLTGVAVSGIELSSNAETLDAGATKQLSFTISPNDATNKNVSWSSSNSSVVKVSSTGLLTAISVGNSDIVVTTADGKKTDTCKVTVQEGQGGFTVYFTKPSNWGSSIKIYYWDPTPSGILPTVTWPGLAMTSMGNGLYKYVFPTITATNLIFNDGTNQTSNLFRDKDGWYKDGVWSDDLPVIIDGAESPASNSEVLLYPNPVSDGRITLTTENIADESIFKLFDLSGKNILISSVSDLHNSINLSSLNKGLYIAKIYTPDDIFTQKIIIE